MSLLTSKATGTAINLVHELEQRRAQVNRLLATVDAQETRIAELKKELEQTRADCEDFRLLAQEDNRVIGLLNATIQSRARLVLLARQNGKMRRILKSVRYKNCPDQKDRDDIDDVLRLK